VRKADKEKWMKRVQKFGKRKINIPDNDEV